MKTKRQKPVFPMVIQRGNVTVQVYRTESAKGYISYQVPDYSTGKRVLESYSDLGKAKVRAAEIAAETNTGDVVSLKGNDKASYLLSLDHIKPTGKKLEHATHVYAEAYRICGDRIIEAAKLLAKKNPDSMPKRTVREVVDELIESKRAAGDVKKRYLQDLKYRLGKLSEAFGWPIANVTGGEVQGFLDGLKLSARSYINFTRVIGTLFRFAIRRGYLPKDFDELDRLEKRRARNGEAIEIFTPDEMARLLNAASADFLPCLALGAFAGLRSAEIERLDWSDIKEDKEGERHERWIEIGASTAKTKTRRIVPVCETLAAWLAPHSRKAGKVWAGSHDQLYDAQQATAAATETKDVPALKWKQNALRHSFISYRLAEIQNINQVAVEAGNSPEMIHQHYKSLVTASVAKRWFALKPDTFRKIVPMNAAVNE